jgi:hypothetical protein
MSFDDLFRDLFGKDRPNKMLPITPSSLLATLARRRGAGRRPPACPGYPLPPLGPQIFEE